MTESFAQLFEESLASQQIRSGQILTGTVVAVTPDVMIVSVGLKSEAVIPAEQFKSESGELDVTVGDEVEVALDAVEDGSGATRLSRRKPSAPAPCPPLPGAGHLRLGRGHGRPL